MSFFSLSTMVAQDTLNPQVDTWQQTLTDLVNLETDYLTDIPGVCVSKNDTTQIPENTNSQVPTQVPLQVGFHGQDSTFNFYGDPAISFIQSSDGCGENEIILMVQHESDGTPKYYFYPEKASPGTTRIIKGLFGQNIIPDSIFDGIKANPALNSGTFCSSWGDGNNFGCFNTSDNCVNWELNASDGNYMEVLNGPPVDVINLQFYYGSAFLPALVGWNYVGIKYTDCNYVYPLSFDFDGIPDCDGELITVTVTDALGVEIYQIQYWVILDDPSCDVECVEEFWVVDPVKGDTLMPGDTLLCVDCTALVAPPLNGGDLPAEYVVTTTVDTTAGVVTYSYEVSSPDCDSLAVVFYGTFGGDCPCLVLTLDDFYLPFADGTTIVIPGDSCGLFDQYITAIDQEFGNHPNVSSVTKELLLLPNGLIKAAWEVNYGDSCNPDGCRGKRLRYKIFFDFSACGIGLEELQSRTMFKLLEEGNTEYFLEVFPNPTSDILNIQTDANKVEIFNVGGGKVWEINFPDLELRTSKVNVSNWPNGIYAVKAGEKIIQVAIVH